MSENNTYKNLRASLENQRAISEKLKMKSELMIKIIDHLENNILSQIEKDNIKSSLQGKIDTIDLQSLIDIGHSLGFHITLQIGD